MNEETIVKTLELPPGQLWEWYGDANVVALSPCLDAAGREVALDEVQRHWRRSCLRVYSGQPTQPTQPTLPLQAVPTSGVPPAALLAVEG